jgi:Barrel-sandwich domain of CusB or HlyD membrane-fusion/Adenylate and Guanylate cyclase catalytic domain
MESFKNIVAPFDGIVTARKTDIGALINVGNAGQELFEVSDLHKVRIYVQVPQAFTAELKPGLQPTFEMLQYPGQQFDAKVVTTSNAMELNSRSILVELQADNADGKLFAGAYCQVHFQLCARRRPVSIGIGIHYGQVFAGVIEAGKRLEFSVIGDAVNTAHRIEELTKTAGWPLLVSLELLEATKTPCPSRDCHPLPAQTVRGRKEALQLFAPVWAIIRQSPTTADNRPPSASLGAQKSAY